MNVKEYREMMDKRMSELKIENVEQTKDISYIKDGIDTMTDLLEKQNGRIRTNEAGIAWMKGVFSVITVFISGAIAWLFKGKL